MFFFDDLYFVPEIKQAFQNICLDKMLSDGYFDMNYFILDRSKKEELYSKLSDQKSKYNALFKDPFPQKEKAYEKWFEIFNDDNITKHNNEIKLARMESVAIVCWIYKILKTKEERLEFTKDLLKNTKELHSIKNDIKLSQNIVFNDKKVEVHFFNSVYEINKYLSSISVDENDILFFRGHSNVNYKLLPSIMREESWKRNEHIMYNEIIINCPESFSNCRTHLEKLVEMQHYGMPTRLLDITRNPLVALYFACEDQSEFYGEVVLISTSSDSVKFPNSDTVSILASLSALKYDNKKELYNIVKNGTVPLNSVIWTQFLHEIRQEKPAFADKINISDLLENFIVYAIKNNNRIIKQDGAFIICGLNEESNMLGNFRYKNKISKKNVVLIVSDKKKIIDQLNNISINQAALFPEIDSVAKFIKHKYS